LSGAGYDDDARQAAFFQELVGRLGALPGVTAAGAVTTLPMNPIGIDYDLPFAADGQPPANPAQQPQVDFRVVAGDYFRAVGIPVLRGHGLASTDRPGGQPVVVVNETLAAQYFPGADPLGRRVWVGGGVGQAIVVGVVGNVRHRGLTDRPRPEVYVPSAQDPHGGMTVVIRAAGDPAALARSLKAQVYALNPNQPVRDVVTLPDLVSRSVAPRRFQLAILGGFAALAVALAAIGVYGVIAYAVGRRRREIGIRIALGAGGPDIRRTVLGPGLAPAAGGVLAGAAGAWALGGLLRGELYEVSPHDPATYLIAAATLLLVAWLACEIPVRRAIHTDPLTALRSE
jgi:putative ABC transport system permease protein